MGYFKIDSVNHPGDRVIGDEPMDIMGDAIDKIVACYKQDIGRPPYMSELLALTGFSSGHLEEEKDILIDSPNLKEHEVSYENLSKAIDISLLAKIPLSLTPEQVDDIICYIEDLKEQKAIAKAVINSYKAAVRTYMQRAFDAERRLEKDA